MFSDDLKAIQKALEEKFPNATSISIDDCENPDVTLYCEDVDVAFYVIGGNKKHNTEGEFYSGWINSYKSDYFKSEGNEGFDHIPYTGVQCAVDAIETVIKLRKDEYKEFEDELAAIDDEYNLKPLNEVLGEATQSSELDVLLAG